MYQVDKNVIDCEQLVGHYSNARLPAYILCHVFSHLSNYSLVSLRRVVDPAVTLDLSSVTVDRQTGGVDVTAVHHSVSIHRYVQIYQS